MAERGTISRRHFLGGLAALGAAGCVGPIGRPGASPALPAAGDVLIRSRVRRAIYGPTIAPHRANLTLSWRAYNAASHRRTREPWPSAARSAGDIFWVVSRRWAQRAAWVPSAGPARRPRCRPRAMS